MEPALRTAFCRWGALWGFCGLGTISETALAQPGADVLAAQTPANGAYYLAAFVNGLDKQLIVRVDSVDGTFYINADELRELGVVTAGIGFDSDQRVSLASIPDLQYRYEADTQRLILTLPPSRLQAQLIGYRNPPPPPPITGTGLMINYAMELQGSRISYAQRNDAQHVTAPALGSGYYGSAPLVSEHEASAAYDALNRTLAVGTELRFFSPLGDIVNSGYTTVEGGRSKYLRQDTYWSYASVDSLLTYTAGDQVSSSLSWSRSVRLGGFSIAHNFTVRPDLVTFPVPALGGSAVVPTTVDLYINGLRQFSGEAGGGPFLIATPPSLNGAGQASVVYRDALGRELQVNASLYVDSRLLSSGLSEWSFEMGYPRLNYGARSFDYVSRPAANGTIRYGLSDRFTLEGHAEATSGLYNLGAGGLLALGRYGVLNASVTINRGASTGEQASVGYQYIAPRFSINLQGIRTYGNYRDLGSLRDVPVPGRQLHASVSVAITTRQNISLTYARQQASLLGGSRILSLGYTATLGSRINLFANAFRDRDQAHSTGAYVGVIVNLDRRISASLSASHYGNANVLSAEANQSIDYDRGGFGWSVLGDEGNGNQRHYFARLAYQGNAGNLSAQIEHSSFGASSFTTHSLNASGSLVWMDGSLLASRPISDAFAVVSTDGTPDVPVLRENRVVGNTDGSGHLLIPDLLSYNSNSVAIDTLNLPADADVPSDHADVAPRARAGVLVHFPIRRYQGAVVILQDDHRQPLPVGTSVTVEGEPTPLLVGYEGKVFLPRMQIGDNRVSARIGDVMCSADIPFSNQDAMHTLGPFICQGAPTP